MQPRLTVPVLSARRLSPSREFSTVYDERFAHRYGYWRPVVAEVVEKYLACGILKHGFARVRCGACKHEYLLALLRRELAESWAILLVEILKGVARFEARHVGGPLRELLCIGATGGL